MTFIAPLKSADEVVARVAEIVRPPRRISPTDAATRYLQNEKGGWNPGLVPYCCEPLDRLAGREYRGIVFVGPARTGKTMGLILGGIAYVITASPGDMLVVQMSQDAARDFSKMDLDRALRHSPELASRLSPRARDDNTFDKFFRSGVVLKLGWPAVSQLSAKTLQYVFLTDYDRPKHADNVDGEGPMWDLAFKRVETYMSRGKCLAESSPGEELVETDWKPSTAHEAPPVSGILSIYNSGTRARWYWPCQHCGEHFEAKPGLERFPLLPEFDELVEELPGRDLMSLADQWAKVACPHCGCLHEPEQRQDLNRSISVRNRIRGATWLHDGESIVDGRIEGVRRRSEIASYWLGGVAAAYQTWPRIVLKYLQGIEEYSRTGDESKLRATTFTDQGAAYVPQAVKRKRTAEELVQRTEDWPEGLIPAGVRFLTAAVDVQAYAFVVTVMGWGVGLESWLIARFRITASERAEGEKFAVVDPAAYVEDWNLLVDQVVEKGYQTEAGVVLKPRVTVCDSGGKEGATVNAYAFWRTMRARKYGRRFLLIKGDGNINAPRVRETWPDARARKDRTAGRGDVPVWLLNVNTLKDGIAGDLNRKDAGPGYVHLPSWLEPGFFNEMIAEVRTEKGWVKQGNAKNEAFDLHTYNRAACILLRAEGIDWQKPPAWAEEPAVQIEEPEPKPEPNRVRRPYDRPPRQSWMKKW